jgi:hypothetical protein
MNREVNVTERVKTLDHFNQRAGLAESPANTPR